MIKALQIIQPMLPLVPSKEWEGENTGQPSEDFLSWRGEWTPASCHADGCPLVFPKPRLLPPYLLCPGLKSLYVFIFPWFGTVPFLLLLAWHVGGYWERSLLCHEGHHQSDLAAQALCASTLAEVSPGPLALPTFPRMVGENWGPGMTATAPGIGHQNHRPWAW